MNLINTRSSVSNAIIAQPTGHAYLILDQKVFQRVISPWILSSVGLVEQADTLAELASQINLDQQHLRETVTEWNAAVKKQNDAQFGRHTGMRTLDTAPFYAIHVAPAVHYTMGGIHIDKETHVLDENGNIIPGLFAAGEVAGGYTEIIGSAEIRLPKQLSLVAKQEFNQARIKLIFVKYQVLFVVY